MPADFDLFTMVKEVGPTLAMLGYFVYKDHKFTGRILELMADVKALLQEVRTNRAA